MSEDNQTGIASNTNSGGNTTYSNDGSYQSSWNIFRRGSEMYYNFKNQTGDFGNPGMLHFRITPYVGLAYYDGTNDGQYNYLNNLLSPLVVNFTVAPTGAYPNIFNPTGNEIGNFMPAQPFTLTGAGLPSYWGTVEMEMISYDHLHVNSAITNTKNPASTFFNLAAPPAPFVAATPQERNILSKYGKVFFYRWEALNPTTLAVVSSGYIMPQCNTSNPFWTTTGVTANLPGIGVTNLYYNTGNPSREIVIQGAAYPWQTSFSYTVGGQTFNYRVEARAFAIGSVPSTELKIYDYF